MNYQFPILYVNSQRYLCPGKICKAELNQNTPFMFHFLTSFNVLLQKLTKSVVHLSQYFLNSVDNKNTFNFFCGR